MNIKALSYILAVNIHRNFHCAAKACGVSQPALSTAIKTFEDDLGLKIFCRSTRKVELTHAGKKIIAQLNVIQGEIHALHDLAKYNKENYTLPIRIVVHATFAKAFFPEIIKPLKVRMPEANIQIFEETNSSAISKIMNNMRDVALIPDFNDVISGLIVEELALEPFVIFTPIGHKFLNYEQVTLADILSETLILPEEGNSIYSVVSAALSENMHVVKKFKNNPLSSIFLMINAGMGISLLPISFASEMDKFNISYCIPDFKIERKVNLVWRANEERTNCIGHIRRAISNLAFGFKL